MKTRKNKQKRKQKGGEDKVKELLQSLNWDLSEEGGYYKISLYEGERILCELLFYLTNPTTAYLESLQCYSKTKKFHPISYIIMYIFLYLLQEKRKEKENEKENSKRVEFVEFLTIPREEDGYKLYKLYHDMGFVCKGNTISINEEKYKTQRNADVNYFKNVKGKTKEEIDKRCIEMYGHVASVIDILEKKIEERV